MEIHGKNIIGFGVSASGTRTFNGHDPRRNQALDPVFHEADRTEVDRALTLADTAAREMARLPAERVAQFLGNIREEILSLGDAPVEKADQESALGLERLRGERDRTVNQIKLFADLVLEGSWVDARIDPALPDRKPLPRPDVRRILEPLGPVVVFGASNFPLAFSVAGGDTASAFAARNPVVVKAHPAHPATSELVGLAIVRAVKKSGLPEGTFSMLHGLSPEPSIALVEHRFAKAVGFTGSQRAGRALFDAAARRPEPIPVFSEMGSVNPVFLLPSALSERGPAVADGLFRSVTLGVGQFCTCPGLAFGLNGAPLNEFASKLASAFEQGVPGTMLNSAISKGYDEAFRAAAQTPAVQVKTALKEATSDRTEGRPGLVMTESRTWLHNAPLHHEVFGPSTVLIRCETPEDMLACARDLEGTLTATVHGTEAELKQYGELIETLKTKAGRLIFNGYPTGVEVGYAMHHGGPYPATTDARFTSVGTAAIYRFAKPVCYQSWPDSLLPRELQNANPRRIWRTVNGSLTRDPL